MKKRITASTIQTQKLVKRKKSQRKNPLKSKKMSLKVHPLFFKEFASKTWTSISRVVSELVENSYDEDATKVLITILDNGSIIVEDNAGMNKSALEKFLLVGSPHKQEERISPRFKRLRSGMYGTGKLGFLTSFKRMIVKTKKGKLSTTLELNEQLLTQLAKGEADLKKLYETSLKREGTEIRLYEPQVRIDSSRLIRELKKLACLKQPFFELYIQQQSRFKEWSFNDAKLIEPPQIEGLRIPISKTSLEGEVIISKLPLPEEERGLAIMVGGHAVARSSFGISSVSADRITGWVRGERLTARFADKSALVEDNAYEEFSKKVKTFLKEKILPVMKDYVEVEITREESRVYRQVDRLLSDAIHHVIESVEGEIEGDFDISSNTIIANEPEIEEKFSLSSLASKISRKIPLKKYSEPQSDQTIPETVISPVDGETIEQNLRKFSEEQDYPEILQKDVSNSSISSTFPKSSKITSSQSLMKTISPKIVSDVLSSKPKQPRQVQHTITLKKVGYRVVPYEDENDEKEAFAEEEAIYVNKAHPAYRAEVQKGGELLLRHVMRLVAKVIALNHHPEGKDALDLQNKLIAEAIRLRQQKLSRRKLTSSFT